MIAKLVLANSTGLGERGDEIDSDILYYDYSSPSTHTCTLPRSRAPEPSSIAPFDRTTLQVLSRARELILLKESVCFLRAP